MTKSGKGRPMKLGAFFIAAAVAAAPCLAGEGQIDAREIIRRCDELMRGEKSYALVTMVIRRPAWERTVTMEAWTEGTEKALIRVLSPKKEKDVTFLKKGREAWQYVPKIDRTVKIPPSMMLQSWMGSDFTNDDVVRADSIVTDYEHTLLSETAEKGVKIWTVQAVPKPDAAVVWGRVVFRVRADTYVPERVDYYDEAGALVKYYVTADVTKVEDRLVPLSFTMHDATEKDKTTAIRYDKLTFSPALSADTFTLKSLKD